MVLVHGFAVNSRSWDLTVPALRERFRTVSVDLRGHGLSAKPTEREEYALEKTAGDVYGLLQRLGIDECYLTAHSMGGMISQHLLLRHPQVVRALVLVDTAAEVPKNLLYSERLQERERLMEIARTGGWRPSSRNNCA